MADFTIDSVNIQIEATAKTASDTVDKLLQKTQQLTRAMNVLKTSTQGLTGSLSTLRRLDAETAASLRRLESIRVAQARTAAATETASARVRAANARVTESIEQAQQRTQQARLRTEHLTARNASQEEIASQRLIQAQERTTQALMRTEQLREQATGRRHARSNVADDVDDEANAYDRMSVIFNKIKALGMSAVFYKIGDAIGGLVTKSNEYIENLNLFMVQMGQFSNDAISFVDLLEEKLGVDPSQSMRYMGFFMQIADSIGVASDSAYLMSKNFTLLAYDLSSFLNIDIEAAMEKLRSGLVGEVEPLRAVGYAITENTLQQVLNESMTRKQYEAYKKLNPEIAENTNVAILNEDAVGKNVRKLTEAQKVELRYVAVMQQATKAMTDMSETLNTPANQMRILRQQIEMAARAIGNIFVPILNKVLPILIAFAQIVREIASSIANLFGFKLPEVDWNRDFAAGAGQAVDAIDDVTDATKKAKKAAKDFTAPFDELNIIKENANTAASGAEDTGAGGGGALFEQLPDYTSFLNDAIGLNVDAIKDKLEDLLQLVGAIAAGLLAWKIADAFLNALPKIKDMLTGIRDKIKEIHDGNIGFSEDMKTTAVVAGTVGAAVGLWVFHFIELYRHSEQFRKGIERVKEIIGVIGEAIGIVASGISTFIIEPLLNLPIIGDVIGFFVDAFKEIKDILSGLGLDVFATDIAMVLGGIALIATGLNPVVGIITLIIEAVTLLVRALGSLDNASFQNFKDGIINGAKGIVTALREFHDSAVEAFDKFKENVKNAIDDAVETFKKLPDELKKIPQTVKDNLSKLPDMIKGIPNTIKETFGNLFKGLKDDAKEALEPVVTEFDGLKTTVGNAISNLPNIVGSVFSTMGTNAINGAKSLVIGVDEKFGEVTTAVNEKFGTNLPTTIENAFSSLAVSGVQGLDTFVTNVNGKFEEVTTSVNETFGTNIPTSISGVLDVLGEDLGAGFDTITQKILDFATDANSNFDEFMIGTGDMGAKVVDFKNEVITNFGNAYDNMKTKLGEMVTEGDNSWLSIVIDTATRLKEWLDGIVTSLKEGKTDWTKWWTEIKDLFKDTWKRIKQKWDEDIKTWWDTSVAPWFTLDKWLGILDNVREAIVTTFQNAVRSATSIINHFIDGINDRMKFEWPDIEIAGETVFGGGSIQLFTIPHIPMFADGGFPSAGEMFIANESGAEMVGSINNKATVVNNDQIVAAVSQGVYAAVLSAMSQQEQQPLIVELDGEVIYNNQKKIENSRGLGNFSMGNFQR